MAKKQTNDQKIIAALDALGKSVRNLQKFGAKYDAYIDEAAMRSDDARAKQLIKQKIRVYALIDQLKTLKSNIELGAYTAQAISELGALPAAIAGCKGLLAESPDFAKLGKSITAIFKDINRSEEELAKLNEILEPKSVESISSRLDGTTVDETEESDQFKAEYAAMIERVKGKIVSEPVSKPEDVGSTMTGDIDYEGIIRKEIETKD